MEGGQLLQSAEILAGRFPYRAPSADYMAFPYQPLYAAIVAALAWLVGLSLPLARAVSIASTLSCAALVGRAVARETGARGYGWLAGAMVIALYRVVGFWFDLARVDSLFVALLVGALYVARYVKGAWRSCLGSALLIVLAYKTKQLAVPFCLLVPPLLAPRSRAAALAFLPLVALPLAVDAWLSQRASGGWFWFYVGELPRAQPYQLSKITSFPWVVVSQVPVLAVLATMAAHRAIRGGALAAKLRETWTLAAILGVGVTIAAWARPGGYANNLMTTCVFAVVPAFVELHRRASRATELGRLLLFAALAGQLLWLRYNPVHQIPTSADHAAGAALVETLRRAQGPVLVPQRPWLAVLAGKGASYHANSYWEMTFLHRPELVPDELRRRLREGYYDVVALDADPREASPDQRAVPDEMTERYACDRPLDLPGRGLAPLAGAAAPGPRVLCRPLGLARAQ
jgi:hypothetical protein